jgi:transcriptional regulator with XRE-family HTH domain
MYVTPRRYLVLAPNKGERHMAVPLNVDPALGRMVREARDERGWTIDDLSAELGRVGDPPKALGRTKLTRLEQGRRNVSAEEAWLLVEIFEELDAWKLLAAARAVDPDASEEYRQATLMEAERRRAVYRESGGNRRRSERWAARALVAASRAASREGASFAATPLTSDQRKASTGTSFALPEMVAA